MLVSHSLITGVSNISYEITSTPLKCALQLLVAFRILSLLDVKTKTEGDTACKKNRSERSTEVHFIGLLCRLHFPTSAILVDGLQVLLELTPRIELF